MINIGIIGANGYTGFELMKILSRHPNARLQILTSRSQKGKKITEAYPSLTALKDQSFEDVDMDKLSKTDVVFSCLPHASSAEICAKLYKSDVKVIDLSADFRYKDIELYENTYKVKHPAPELLKSAVYGLPELYRDQIKNSSLVGNPGCYPTSAILPLYPLLKENIINNSSLIIDSKSGTSGAGKKADVDLIFSEVNESLKAYAVTTHRHTSEIEEVLSLNSKSDVTVCFTPHLLPITRGILSAIYAPLNTAVTMDDIYSIYAQYYQSEPFVKVIQELPQIKWVANTNNIFIGFRIDSKNNMLIIISVLDNLIKGASGQAVQNMNIMFGLPETTGLVG
ncbi:MAG TPA: N-acetyl-gamma-glutamyl-phosphate reductase [Clostridiales bacterium]|nr:N-acetyl-gamma-glutamyl-phosphate reductase [Clostridiales bacterium]